MSALDRNVIVGVVGAGTMGAGIAQVAAAAGHPVRLYDSRTGAASAAIGGIGSQLERVVAKGRMAASERQALLERLQAVEELEALAPCGLVIEAVIEDLDAKRQLFVVLEDLVGEHGIFATNTSSLSVTAVAAALKDPMRVVGMHFFNPAPRMPLVEVVTGLASDPTVVRTVVDTARAWGKSPVQVRSTPGFIVNRVARPFYAEALRALSEGAADVATIDAVMRESGGFRMGPFELMDLIGIDVNRAVTASVFEAFHYDPRFEPSLIQRELVAAGRLGRKSGGGFYDYSGNVEKVAASEAPPQPAPERIVVHGALGAADSLLDLAAQRDITVERHQAPLPGAGWIEVGTAKVALSDGRSATERARQGLDNLVLFDLAPDYAQAERIALAVADQTEEQAAAHAIGFFQALGKRVSVIDDHPGMLVMRTVCMLANLGADAVHQQVCSAAAVDTAMEKGVNYPKGPLAWAEAIGLAQVVTVLDHLARGYGEDRYRVSPLLRRKVFGGKSFSGRGGSKDE